MFGFSLNFDGVLCSTRCSNNHSTKVFENAVTEKINSELSVGRFAGPFNSSPFTNFKVSPLSIIQKKNSSKFRLLHNLSAPYDFTAVNSNIDASHSRVSYASIANAISLINRFPNPAFLAKTDISEAFRLIPLRPSDYMLTGFKWKDSYYYDKCLPMGASSSCKIFERVSDSLIYIMRSCFNMPNIVKVLDDFLFIAPSEAECRKYLFTFQSLCEKLKIPLASHKTVMPTTRLTFLGIELDTVTRLARLPAEKLSKCRSMIYELLPSSSTTLRDLQSIIGLLQFASTVVRPGRCFLRRLHDATLGKNIPHSKIKCTDQVKADLQMWLMFLNVYNGITLFPVALEDRSNYVVYSDASKSGYGVVFNCHWFGGVWPQTWHNYDITFLELFPIYMAIRTFSNIFGNGFVKFNCDNEAITTIINNQTTKNKKLMCIVRLLVLDLLKYNINLTAVHIPGKKNVLADKISRQQISQSLLSSHGVSTSPYPVKSSIRPQNFKLQCPN